MNLALAKEDTVSERTELSVSVAFSSHRGGTPGVNYSSCPLLTGVDASWAAHSRVGRFQSLPWGLRMGYLGASHALAVLVCSPMLILSAGLRIKEHSRQS